MHWEQALTTVLYRERAAYLQWDTDRSVADPRGAELGDEGDGAIDTVTARKTNAGNILRLETDFVNCSDNTRLCFTTKW